jgi:hypothetical protein
LDVESCHSLRRIVMGSRATNPDPSFSNQ